MENELKIKVEPGFIENMIDCVNKPIGYEDIEELAKHHSRLDTAYVPILNREKLAQDYKDVCYISIIISMDRIYMDSIFLASLSSESKRTILAHLC